MNNDNDIFGKVAIFDDEGMHKLASKDHPLSHWDIISDYTVSLMVEHDENFLPYVFHRLNQEEGENFLITKLNKALFIDLIPEEEKAAAYLLLPEKISSALYDNIMEYKEELASYDELNVVTINKENNEYTEHTIGSMDTLNTEKLDALNDHVERPFRR